MFSILLGMSAIIIAGIGWRLLLGSQKAEAVRGHLTRGVYDIFLPALVLHVMWQTEVNLNTVRLPLVAIACILLSLLTAALVYQEGRWFPSGFRSKRAAVGALLLAASFGNFTYLGLPVLTQTFGPDMQSVAIYFDLFASTPLLFTVGVMLARKYGANHEPIGQVPGFLKVPAVWAAIAGVMLSAMHIGIPGWLKESLGVLGAAVVPLMLLSIGMALRWQSGWAARIPVLLPMLAIQLLWMPLIAWAMSIGVGMPAELLAPVIVEAAMPCMVLGLVICDRFKLDSGLYAEAVTVSTALSLFTLPMWLHLSS